jgi:hypothetical protein
MRLARPGGYALRGSVKKTGHIVARIDVALSRGLARL